MDWIKHTIDHFSSVESVQFVYGFIAMCGGVSRYFNAFAEGKTQFSTGIFFASAFVAGFSGWMFALVGTSLNLPQAILFVMAGAGGFFGEQTMKFIMEYLQLKVKP